MHACGQMQCDYSCTTPLPCPSLLFYPQVVVLVTKDVFGTLDIFRDILSSLIQEFAPGARLGQDQLFTHAQGTSDGKSWDTAGPFYKSVLDFLAPETAGGRQQKRLCAMPWRQVS